MRALIIILCLFAAPSMSYGAQHIGGNISLGGKPPVNLIQNPIACDAPRTNVNSLVVGANAPGINRLLLAIVQFNGTGASVSSVSTGSQSFTLVGTAQAENLIKASIWRLIAPVAGTQTVTAQLSEIVGAASLCVIAWENVNQSTPTAGFVSAGSGSNTVNITTSSAAGNIVISAFVSANNAVVTADDTALYSAAPGAIVVARIGRKDGAASVNVTMGLAGTNAHNELLVDIVKN